MYSLVKDFGLVYKQEMLRKKLYVSELTLRTDRQLNNINPRMQAFVRKIISIIGTDDPGLMELSSLSFWWDLDRLMDSLIFSLSELQTPFSERRYYSGPLSIRKII